MHHKPIEPEESAKRIQNPQPTESERKISETALRNRASDFWAKSDSPLQPEGDPGELELADIIDTPAIQSLMDDFYEITHLALAILDLRGNLLIANGFQDVCTKFHRAHPQTSKNCTESDTMLSNGVERGKFKLYRCKNNMWDMSSPIIIGDRRLGNIFYGQFFFEDETPDLEIFRAQARKYGFDEKEYLAAIERAPRLSRKTVNRIMTFYTRLALMISDLSYSNIKLSRSLAERNNALSLLQKSEAKYRQLSDSLPQIVFETDDQGKVTFANRIAFEYLGYTREDFKKGLHALDIVIPEDRERGLKNLRKILNGQPSGGNPYTVLRKNGSTFPAMIYSAPLFSEEKVSGIIGIMADLSEHQRAEAEKERLQDQLFQAQKMESVGRLAGGVAHDFNNMLQTILGYADMALETVGPGHPIHDSLTEIHKAAKRSADLTRQLLAFARKQTISPRVMDLNDAVAGMLKMLQRLIGEDIELVWKPGANLWPVKIDPSQVDQILANLSVNARDAIASVGNLTIETKNATFDETYCSTHADIVPGEYVLLGISDTGCGMNRDTLTHLFEPFFTTKELGKGTGLGLSTVYGVVKQNNGFINVYSEPGHGTSFKIYLPRVHEAAQTKPAGAQSDVRGAETVLLVEDEPSILELGQITLENCGYTVLSASTPSKALTLAERHEGPIHLLITDVVMPEMNGKQLRERITTLRPGIKSLFMSGYTADVIAHHGVVDQGVHFLEKPFSLYTLAAKVREVLDH